MREPLRHRPFAPGEIGFFRLASLLSAETLGDGEQAVGRIRTAIEHDVLAGLAQFRIEIVIDRHLAGIDDAHIHAGLDRVIQKHRMHRLAHRLVAAERERQVGDAAGNMRVRQVLADPARGLDEGDAVTVMLFDAGRDREDVRIENNVFRREADFIDQNVVGALADRASCARACRPGPARRTPSPPPPRRSGARFWRAR